MANSNDYFVWTYKDFRVVYCPELDGRGSVLDPSFVESILRRRDRQYECAYEWCAGPAFIGFALLAEGICRRFCLSDVNPAAVDCVQRTLAENGLKEGVVFYLSDNLREIPDAERFDLVVANPPNFYALNPKHSRYAEFKGDLRPNDPHWRLHRDFYAGIRSYLLPDAELYISEVEPERDVAFIPKHETEPFDARPRPASDDFLEMIRDGGLEYVDTIPYYTGQDGAELFQMISRKAGAQNPARTAGRPAARQSIARRPRHGFLRKDLRQPGPLRHAPFNSMSGTENDTHYLSSPIP